jgi:outer membrane lipopolysaccharide assembly protein LptE/RlpB
MSIRGQEEGALISLSKKIVALYISFAVSCLFVSCGYQMVREGGLYGGDISSLDVPLFKNLSYEPHASFYATEAFSRELISTGLFKINAKDSDAYLKGTLTRIQIDPYTTDERGLVVEKQVTLDIEFALYKKDGTFLKKLALSDSEIYRVDNINAEDYNKRDAIERASQRMARRLTALLLVDY